MNKKIIQPKLVTISAKDYFDSWNEINRLFYFVIGMAGNRDRVSEVAHNALIATESNAAKREEMEKRWKERKTSLEELKKNRQILLESIIVRHVENFINFLSSILFEIFTSRPETLRSSDKIEVSKVLEHDSIESLVREIAENKVDSLSYSSFSKISEFFAERFHITLASQPDAELIHKFIEIRNISVHNRCKINKRYLARVKQSDVKIGEKIQLYVGDLDIISEVLFKAVSSIDKSVRKKMRIRSQRMSVIKVVDKPPSEK